MTLYPPCDRQFEGFGQLPFENSLVLWSKGKISRIKLKIFTRDTNLSRKYYNGCLSMLIINNELIALPATYFHHNFRFETADNVLAALLRLDRVCSSKTASKVFCILNMIPRNLHLLSVRFEASGSPIAVNPTYESKVQKNSSAHLGFTAM